MRIEGVCVCVRRYLEIGADPRHENVTLLSYQVHPLCV